jgi:hypothetical protein
MGIGYSFISAIGGNYWLLVPILFVAINVFLMVILLTVIGGYSINGH